MEDILDEHFFDTNLFQKLHWIYFRKVIPINDISDTNDFKREEITLRRKLAAAFRLLDLMKLTDVSIKNMITTRFEDRFLINPYGLLNCEITASSISTVNLHGDVIKQGSIKHGVNETQFETHAVIYKFRPDIRCIIEVKHKAVLGISALKQELLPLSDDYAMLGNVIYHNPNEGKLEELVVKLKTSSKVIIFANYGAFCCGKSIEEALYLSQSIVRAAKVQMSLLSVAEGELSEISTEVQTIIKSDSRDKQEAKVQFDALVRLLDVAGFCTGLQQLENKSEEVDPTSSCQVMLENPNSNKCQKADLTAANDTLLEVEQEENIDDTTIQLTLNSSIDSTDSEHERLCQELEKRSLMEEKLLDECEAIVSEDEALESISFLFGDSCSCSSFEYREGDNVLSSTSAESFCEEILEATKKKRSSDGSRSSSPTTLWHEIIAATQKEKKEKELKNQQTLPGDGEEDANYFDGELSDKSQEIEGEVDDVAPIDSVTSESTNDTTSSVASFEADSAKIEEQKDNPEELCFLQDETQEDYSNEVDEASKNDLSESQVSSLAATFDNGTETNIPQDENASEGFCFIQKDYVLTQEIHLSGLSMAQVNLLHYVTQSYVLRSEANIPQNKETQNELKEQEIESICQTDEITQDDKTVGASSEIEIQEIESTGNAQILDTKVASEANIPQNNESQNDLNAQEIESTCRTDEITQDDETVVKSSEIVMPEIESTGNDQIEETTNVASEVVIESSLPPNEDFSEKLNSCLENNIKTQEDSQEIETSDHNANEDIAQNDISLNLKVRKRKSRNSFQSSKLEDIQESDESIEDETEDVNTSNQKEQVDERDESEDVDNSNQSEPAVLDDEKIQESDESISNEAEDVDNSNQKDQVDESDEKLQENTNEEVSDVSVLNNSQTPFENSDTTFTTCYTQLTESPQSPQINQKQEKISSVKSKNRPKVMQLVRDWEFKMNNIKAPNQTLRRSRSLSDDLDNIPCKCINIDDSNKLKNEFGFYNDAKVTQKKKVNVSPREEHCIDTSILEKELDESLERSLELAYFNAHYNTTISSVASLDLQDLSPDAGIDVGGASNSYQNSNKLFRATTDMFQGSTRDASTQTYLSFSSDEAVMMFLIEMEKLTHEQNTQTPLKDYKAAKEAVTAPSKLLQDNSKEQENHHCTSTVNAYKSGNCSRPLVESNSAESLLKISKIACSLCKHNQS